MRRARRERPEMAEVLELRRRLVAMGYRGADLAALVKLTRRRDEIVSGLIAMQQEAARTRTTERR